MSSYTAHEVFADEASDYLDKHNIYELFGSILKDLVINKPKDPLTHMIALLERPETTHRVMVLGAPGSGYEEQSDRIVKDFGVVSIQIDKLFDSEVDNRTSLGAKVKDCRDHDLPISDELTTTVIKSRLNKTDCLTKGWILHDYPTTASQLQSLQHAGVLPNKVVVLDAPSDVTRARAAKSELFSDLSIPELDELIKEHEAKVSQILPLFPESVKHFIDSSQEPDAVWAKIRTFLTQLPPSKAPRRPMRVALLGPTGSGKQTQCTKLAHKFGLVHLSTGSLLRAEMERNEDLKAEMTSYLDAGALLPDDVVCPIVVKRLLQNDCRSRGWVLDGFPRNEAQADALAKAHLAPNRVVFLEVPTKVAQGRCFSRRVDPATGDEYDMRAATPPQDVAKRLVTNLKDQEAVFHTLELAYSHGALVLKERYADVTTTIDGTASESDVFAQIESFYLASLGAVKFG